MQYVYIDIFDKQYLHIRKERNSKAINQQLMIHNENHATMVLGDQKYDLILRNVILHHPLLSFNWFFPNYLIFSVDN